MAPKSTPTPDDVDGNLNPVSDELKDLDAGKPGVSINDLDALRQTRARVAIGELPVELREVANEFLESGLPPSVCLREAKAQEAINNLSPELQGVAFWYSLGQKVLPSTRLGWAMLQDKVNHLPFEQRRVADELLAKGASLDVAFARATGREALAIDDENSGGTLVEINGSFDKAIGDLNEPSVLSEPEIVVSGQSPVNVQTGDSGNTLEVRSFFDDLIKKVGKVDNVKKGRPDSIYARKSPDAEKPFSLINKDDVIDSFSLKESPYLAPTIFRNLNYRAAHAFDDVELQKNALELLSDVDVKDAYFAAIERFLDSDSKFLAEDITPHLPRISGLLKIRGIGVDLSEFSTGLGRLIANAFANPDNDDLLDSILDNAAKFNLRLDPDDQILQSSLRKMYFGSLGMKAVNEPVFASKKKFDGSLKFLDRIARFTRYGLKLEFEA